MRTNISRVGILRKERISDRSNVLSFSPAVEPTPELPRGQVIYLLRLRGGGPESLFGKVLHYLEAVGSDEPTSYDRTQLRDARLIRFDRVLQRDKLLPPGLSVVAQIAKDYARRYGIHHLTTSGGHGTGKGTLVHCACGQTFGPFHNDRFGLSRARSQMVAHERRKVAGNPDAVVASVDGAASGNVLEAT